MKLKFISMLVAFIVLFSITASIQADAKTNKYERNYSHKKYTVYFNNDRTTSSFKLNGVLPGLEYNEFYQKGYWIIGNPGVGTIKIKDSKTVYYNQIETNGYKKVKVKTGYKVKTKAKTFKNCMKISLRGTTIYVAPKAGVVKYIQSGKTLFEMKSIKSK